MERLIFRYYTMNNIDSLFLDGYSARRPSMTFFYYAVILVLDLATIPSFSDSLSSASSSLGLTQGSIITLIPLFEWTLVSGHEGDDKKVRG